MPGQHRKPAATRKLAPLAVCGVAATVIGIVSVEMGSTQAAQPAPVADARPEPARNPAPAAAPTLPAPAPVHQVAAADPALMAKSASQHTPCPSVLAGALPHVAQVGNLIGKTFAVADIGGAIGRGNDDHGAGLALDFMTSDRAHGDAIANFVLANKERFGVTYVIWQQRYNDGSGWSFMEDRGSATANHYDHVHVSFAPSANVNLIC
ncbi:hypothetical protein [Nocardia cyriacigeorgica]|uniref:hypothetical protein n=1 Tax=Nocardia cyriacigeorgica TaxID=135487 RepID=UPI001893EF53|nr:hypothetical protein [Nocardia cyriacigeorgica]MBF6454556.1 hypothetical protein [Nocardia cyriacigeorgica]MBF6482404.1 hypothetical protein [Nocardia cyriacigeorgica]MBF6552450.1 hypothetical protein [Nocardia cyriacigeorgica]